MKLKVLLFGVSSIWDVEIKVVNGKISPILTAGVSCGEFTFSVIAYSLISNGIKFVKLHVNVFKELDVVDGNAVIKSKTASL